MVPEENPSVLTVIIGGVIAAIGFIGMWVWNHTMGRIRALETGKVDKPVFEQYTAAAEVSRKEIRDSMERGRIETRETFISVFAKLDEIKDIVKK